MTVQFPSVGGLMRLYKLAKLQEHQYRWVIILASCHACPADEGLDGILIHFAGEHMIKVMRLQQQQTKIFCRLQCEPRASAYTLS